MNKVKIITDSCSDLNEKLLTKYDIDYAKMNTVYNGIQTPAKLNMTPYEFHNMCDLMRNGENITTTQVPVNEFKQIFTKYLELGYDIIYIGCCIKQSGSINTSRVVAGKLLDNYPSQKIICIDSLNASIGEGMLAIEAAKLALDGKDIEEISNTILSIRKNIHEYVTVHSLDALRRAGRVKASSAFFGNLMGVKPILVADADGNQAAYKKVKGRTNSFREIVALLKEAIIDAENQTIYLAHSDCSDIEVDEVRKLLKEEIPCQAIETVYIGPVIGASVGPDTIGIWAFGSEVTFKAGE